MGLENLNLEVKNEPNKMVLYSGSNGQKKPVLALEPTSLGRYIASFKAGAEDPEDNFNKLMLFLLSAHKTHDMPPDVRRGYCEDPLNSRGYPAKLDISRAYDSSHAEELFRKSRALCFSMETDMFPFIDMRSSIADSKGYLPRMWPHHTHSVMLETEKNVAHDLSNLLVSIGAGDLDQSHLHKVYPALEKMTGLAMQYAQAYKQEGGCHNNLLD